MVSVSVVVATLQSYDELDVVDYLERGTYDDYEVVVRDDYPVCRARNEGIRQASADKIVFLDDDSLPREDYLERAVETLEQEPAFSGRTVHPRADVFGRHFTAHYNRGEEPRYVDTFWGNNMGVRREVFETVGGWDENMGWGHEEKELAARVRTQFDILYDPDLVVSHSYADSVPGYWRKMYNLETQHPYYWRKVGYSMREVVSMTVFGALNPKYYVVRGLKGSLVKAGAQLAGTAGRIRGVLDLLGTDSPDFDSGIPSFESRTARQNPTTSTE
ncbi:MULTISPECIES: glycosyltransferase family 2 protein [Haloarcula]|uniref:glycosyltransferase family 2 protein n=1 Tax=Haloarcula TaxID=2237 RepID=UPI0023ED93C2|nr:glycosyltransferase [Halomicroarcula sp. XH51]